MSRARPPTAAALVAIFAVRPCQAVPASAAEEADLAARLVSLAVGCRVQGGVAHPAFRIDIGAFGPAGGMASTAADMARFLRFLVSDGAIDGQHLLQPGPGAAARAAEVAGRYLRTAGPSRGPDRSSRRYPRLA
jgi:CubicO group peptidase (beta-lactamase class C family)